MRILINIDVPDLNQAIHFYCEALGLHLSRRLGADVAELTGSSSVIYLQQKEAGTPAARTAPESRHYTRHWTPVHVDFVVDDLELASKRAMAAGAVPESSTVEWRGSKCRTFSDPFGHGFCLIEFEQQTYSSDTRGD